MENVLYVQELGQGAKKETKTDSSFQPLSFFFIYKAYNPLRVPIKIQSHFKPQINGTA